MPGGAVIPECREVQHLRRKFRPPADGDRVDPETARRWVESRCQRAQGSAQAVQPLGIDDPLGGWVVPAGFDFHRDPGPASADQEVDLGMDGSEVSAFDTVAGAPQEQTLVYYLLLPNILTRIGLRSRAVRSS